MVIGGGAAAVFVDRGAAGFFRATASPGARRVAATGAKALGSSGTGTRIGVFGGAARRGKDSDPQTGIAHSSKRHAGVMALHPAPAQKKRQAVPA
jgi:hypothetical protein